MVFLLWYTSCRGIMNKEKMIFQTGFRNGIARKCKAAKCISGIFAAIFMSLGMKSAVAAVELPETHPDGQVYEDGDQQMDGWREIEGQKYYFYPESGQMAVGWMELDGEFYYFYPESGRMAAGWMELDGKSYYFYPGDGQMAIGCWEIDDDTYYFSPETGAMLTGWQKTEIGRRYFLKASGRMATGWRKIKGRKYYFSKIDGEPAVGRESIGGKYYLFHSDGHLANAGKTSLVTVGSRIYCADKNGRPASGWQIIGKKLYYAGKTGRVKRDITYRGISFGRTGAAKNNVNARLKIKAMKVFASITKKNMTKSQKLAACWSYVTGGNFRYAVKYPNINNSGWQGATAYDMISSHTGNCYSFDCVFAALAEEAGNLWYRQFSCFAYRTENYCILGVYHGFIEDVPLRSEKTLAKPPPI